MISCRACPRGARWVVSILFAAVACSPAPESPGTVAPPDEVARLADEDWREIETPAGNRAMAPNLATFEDRLYLSWLERSEGEEGEAEHRLLVSRLLASGWSEPVTVAAGGGFFANWADFPGVAAAADGTLFAHWLAKTGEQTYAYSIYLARSADGGASWQHLGSLNDDETPTEHGFVAYSAEGRGVRAFWLDGREMVDDRPMTLRTAWIGDRVGKAEVLDDRVCECCSTDAALGDGGPIVVFRDRGEEEIRDISIVRRASGEWTAARTVHADEWRINGCPVNGPAVAAAGETVAVTWYTAGGDRPQVQIAFSVDAGESFDVARVVDGGKPLGRVDVVFDDRGEAVVSWLEGSDGEAEIRLRRLSLDGAAGKSLSIARTSAARASGFPRLARMGQHLYLAWVEIEGEDTSSIRVREVPVSALG